MSDAFGPRCRPSDRAKSSFVSPADAASIAIAGLCNVMLERQDKRSQRILKGEEK